MQVQLIQTQEQYEQAEKRLTHLFSKSELESGELMEISKLTTLMDHYEQKEGVYGSIT